MLNILRKRAQSFVIQAVVFLIAVVFIFWGVGSNLGGNRNAVATVNGEDITIQEFQRAYSRLVEQYQQQLGGQIPEGLLENLKLNDQVLNQLIQSTLLRQGADNMGIRVSDHAVQTYIEDMEAFQVEGRFNLERYNEILSRSNMTPTGFERSVRDELLSERVVKAIGSFSTVSDTEVRQWTEFVDEEIRLDYRGYAGREYASAVNIDEEALAAWYAKRQGNYQSEERVRLQYLTFTFSDDLDQVEVSPEEIKTYYTEHLAEYQQAEERRARHILFRVEQGAEEAVRAAQEAKAKEVLALFKANGDFAALATEYSEGPTKTNGGDLGFFPQGKMVQEFDDAVFAAAVGEVIGPVKTAFGYHLILVEEIKPAATQTLDEVREGIIAKLRQQGVKGITFKRASAAYEAIIKSGSLAAYKDEGGDPVQVSPFFSRSAAPEGMLADPEVLNVAFTLNKGALSSMIETGSGYCIMYVEDKEPPQPRELAEVRQQVEADYRQEKAVDLARDAADQALTAAREQDRLSGADVKQSAYVKRDGQGAKAVPVSLVKHAFSLAAGVDMPEQPVVEAETFYIYQVVDRRIPEGQDGTEAVMQELLMNKREQVVTGWLENVEEDAKIWVNKGLLR
ncbi:MAG: hypothetical protein CSA34_00510 [Desulfobulbus propionicus]|nr:MAG: hypothetical protein CSA34_00510 [Desulfobulbus propionicus]